MRPLANGGVGLAGAALAAAVAAAMGLVVARGPETHDNLRPYLRADYDRTPVDSVGPPAIPVGWVGVAGSESARVAAAFDLAFWRVEPDAEASAGGDDGQRAVSYRWDVRPLLRRECVACHGGRAGLYVHSYRALMVGSTAGPVVRPGDPEGSALLQRLKGLAEPRMPLDRPPLAEEEVSMVERWVAAGALDN